MFVGALNDTVFPRLRELNYVVDIDKPQRVNFELSFSKESVFEEFKTASNLIENLSKEFEENQFFTDLRFPLLPNSKLICISMVRTNLGIVEKAPTSLRSATARTNVTVNATGNASGDFFSSDVAHWFALFETETNCVVMTELSKWKLMTETSDETVYGFRVGIFEKGRLPPKYKMNEFAKMRVPNENQQKRIEKMKCCEGFVFETLINTILVFWNRKLRYNVLSNSCQTYGKYLLYRCIVGGGSSSSFLKVKDLVIEEEQSSLVLEPEEEDEGEEEELLAMPEKMEGENQTKLEEEDGVFDDW